MKVLIRCGSLQSFNCPRVLAEEIRKKNTKNNRDENINLKKKLWNNRKKKGHNFRTSEKIALYRSRSLINICCSQDEMLSNIK